jgi:AbrB family looped-hinge helix DNA binding protein
MPPKGKHIFGIVRVGEKGQIVIPKDARKIFDIKPGDTLMVLGDEEQGLALMKSEGFLEMAQEIFKAAREIKEDEE